LGRAILAQRITMKDFDQSFTPWASESGVFCLPKISRGGLKGPGQSPNPKIKRNPPGLHILKADRERMHKSPS